MVGLVPLLMGMAYGAYKKLNPKPMQMPNMPPGPTDAEVLASDLRLRRSMTAQRGRKSTLVSGGLADSAARLTMPSLVGV